MPYTNTQLRADGQRYSINEAQTITRTATGGTVTLTFSGQTTGTIPSTAAGLTAAAVEAALEALSNVAPADVAVTGPAGGPLVVAFGGEYNGDDVPLITVDNTSATGGTVTVATTSDLGPATVERREKTYVYGTQEEDQIPVWNDTTERLEWEDPA